MYHLSAKKIFVARSVGARRPLLAAVTLEKDENSVPMLLLSHWT